MPLLRRKNTPAKGMIFRSKGIPWRFGQNLNQNTLTLACAFRYVMPSGKAETPYPAIARNSRARAGGIAPTSTPVKTCSLFISASTTA